MFSDPPYNIKIEDVVSCKGKTKHRDFAMGVGEMSDDQFRGFLADYLRLCKGMPHWARSCSPVWTGGKPTS